MKKCFCCLLAWLWIFPAVGQKANFRQADRFMHNKTDLYLGSTEVTPYFNSDTDHFWYKYARTDTVRIYYVDPKRKVQTELFPEQWAMERMTELSGLKLASRSFRPVIAARDRRGATYDITYGGHNFVFDNEAGEITYAGQAPETRRGRRDRGLGVYSPDSTRLVYSENYDLYMENIPDSTVTRLTDDGERHYAYMGSDFMGVRFDEDPYRTPPPIIWLAGGRRFCVLREDVRKVGTLPLVDPYAGRPAVKQSVYTMAGDEFLPRAEMWLFDTGTGAKQRVDIEKWTDQTVTIVQPDSGRQLPDKIFFTREKRTRDEIELCRVDAATGEVRVIIHEKGEPYLADEHFSVTVLNGGDDILWWSERTGRGHYYRYDSDGRLLNAVTGGDWTAGKIVRIDTVGRTIYFEGYGQEEGGFPYYCRINKARFDGRGGVTVLTPEGATHKADRMMFSPSAKYFVDNYSRPDLAPVSILRDNNGKVVMGLNHADLGRLHEAGWRMPEQVRVMAADDSTELFGYMYKPFDFDPSRKYPVISYVYPGPQTEQVPLVFSMAGQYNTALAQVGFIVVTIGHRGGSPMRDKAYHSYGYGNIRDYALADDKYALEQLAARYPFIDIGRVGIFGHSGGGMMAAAAMFTYPDFYKAGVAASGNHDNNIYFRQFVELYHGVEERAVDEKQRVRDPETGRDTTVVVQKTKFVTDIPTTVQLAANLRGHLMIVTGDMDNNVHPAHSHRLAAALVRAGKNFDFVILPGERHAYTGANRDFFERKVWFHFAKHLLGDYSAETFYNINGYKDE